VPAEEDAMIVAVHPTPKVKEEEEAKIMVNVPAVIVGHLECSVCLETLNKPMTVSPCMHSFCKACIEEYRKFNNNCPMCRQTIDVCNMNTTLAGIIEDMKK